MLCIFFTKKNFFIIMPNYYKGKYNLPQMIFMDVGYILNKDYFGKYNSSLGMLCSITFLAE